MPDRMFSFIFVDAPCSGMGTLRRHPEIRWRTSEEDLAGFVETQLGMLKAAAGHVALGGALAYSTCTVTREENAGVVKARRAPASRLISCAAATALQPALPPARRMRTSPCASFESRKNNLTPRFHAGEGFFAGMKHIGNNFARTIHLL